MNVDIKGLLEGVKNGSIDPLDAFKEMRLAEKQLKDALNEIHADAVSAAEKYSNKSFRRGSYEFTLNKGRAMWDFSTVDEWVDAKDKMKTIEAYAKARYNGRSIGGAILVDEETGAEMQYPVVRYSKESISIKFVGDGK